MIVVTGKAVLTNELTLVTLIALELLNRLESAGLGGVWVGANGV